MTKRRISVNRGAQLNQMRLRGELVDVRLSIKEYEFPAHKFVISMYSPYLKALVFGSGFREEGGPTIPLNSSLSPSAFSALLEYLYSGEILLTDENIFDVLEVAHYLQILDEMEDSVTELLSDMIESVRDLQTFIKMWDFSERFNLKSISSQIYSVLEYRLEEFISEDIFRHMGLQELDNTLQNPRLCVRDEQKLFESLRSLLHEENNVDILEKFGGILSKFFRFNSIYWQSDDLPLIIQRRFLCESDDQRSQHSIPSRNCQNCVYVFEYSKNEELNNSDAVFSQNTSSSPLFLKEKKVPTFACFRINDSPSISLLPSLTKGDSYYQHYGPHSLYNSNFITSSNSLILLGGLNSRSNLFCLKKFNLSSDLASFDYSSGTWQRFKSSIPIPSIDFGSVLVEKKIYLFGGLVEDFRSSYIREVRYLDCKFRISRKTFVAREEDLTKMTCWQSLAEMPAERRDFSTIHANGRIYLIGNGFADIYDIEYDSWSSLDCGIKIQSKPASALIGSLIYVSDEENNFYSLNICTHQWSSHPILQLPSPFKVIDVFAHNNCLYILGNSGAKDNRIYKYDPEKPLLETFFKGITGTMYSGVLVRAQWFNKKFFLGSKAICSKSNSKI